MKLKKILSLLFLTPLVISCNNNSMAGTYKFQMGKEKGTHFGLFLELKDNPYTAYEDVKDCKELELSFDASFATEELGSILDLLKNEEGKFALDGYYRLEKEKTKAGEQRMVFGLSFMYIFKTFEDFYKESMGDDLTEEQKNNINLLDNINLIQSIVYATYMTGEVNIYVPVSIPDVYYQLYWYGYDVQVDETSYAINLVETPKHEVGTEPTKEEVEQINKTFADTHAGKIYTSYRAFHDLKLTLIK